MKYLKPFNENSEDELRQGLFELNGEISHDEIEICFIDLMDDGIIKLVDVMSIVDRWNKISSLTTYINVFFTKDSLNNEEDIQKYLDYKLTRFRELFGVVFPNYKITSIGAETKDDYDLRTRRCDTIKVISEIPLNR